MPHCILEYTRDVLSSDAVTELLPQLHKAVVATGLYPVENVKVRAIPVDHALVAGRSAPFLHCTMRILTGKTLEQRQLISSTVFETLTAAVSGIDAVTVEVVEMERESYQKLTSA